jgi:hypothetical protein
MLGSVEFVNTDDISFALEIAELGKAPLEPEEIEPGPGFRLVGAGRETGRWMVAATGGRACSGEE